MINKLLKQAFQKYQQGNLEAALASYKKVLQKDPNETEALHVSGIILSKLGHQNEALSHLDQAIKLEPENPTFQNSRGNILTRQKRFIEATIAYSNAIQLRPNDATTHSNIANCFFRQKKWKCAEREYLKAIALQPDSANVHYNYARLLIKQKNYSKAVLELKKAIRISPHYTQAISQLGHIYLYRENYQEAIIYYKKCIELDSKNYSAYYNCGLAYLKNNQFQEATYYLTNAISLNANHHDCHYVLATAYVQQGEHKLALTHYLRQLEKFPTIDCYYNIGVLHMYQERHSEAIAYFNQALKIKPNYLAAHLNIAAIYLKTNKINLSIKHYKKALDIKPNDLEIEYILTALENKETPPIAPKAYIKHLFNEYANHYDKHLNLILQYQVPQELYKVVQKEFTPPLWRILDLGCGTGLCGEYFKPLAKELIGVDLSEKMISIAKNKNIYTILENCSLEEALKMYHDLDLVLAGDVFTYFGDLSDIFKKTNQALRYRRLFAFSVEKTTKSPYELKQTIRYGHSKPYLISLIKENNFEILKFNNIILRKQKKEPLEGYLVLLRSL